MFEQAFKNIDDVLWKEAGCTTELDYTEQTSWLLFLKYLDGLEEDKADEAKLEGKKYTFILDKPYRWESWAAPKGKDGKLDHNTAKTGDDLLDFVNQKLFPFLIRPMTDIFDPSFLAFRLLEPQMQEKLLAHSRGATVQHVNMKDIRALDVGAIPPLRVQQQIAENVNAVSAEGERLARLYERKLAALEALKKSLLHQAFAGQLQ